MNKLESIKKVVRRISGSLTENDKIISFITLSDSLTQKTVVANLAAMYSQANVNTVIIDLDFSQNSIAKAFDIKDGLGLSDYLSNYGLDFSDIISNTSVRNLKVVASGKVKPSETSYLSSSPRLRELLEVLSKKYDLVLLNTPVIDGNQDYMELKKILKQSDGVILVSRLAEKNKIKMYSLFNKIKMDNIKLLGYINARK